MQNQPDAIALHDQEPELEDFAAAVRRGLESHPRQLPCKFFYDERGSKLFDAICELPEYYPTRTEIGILESLGEELAQLVEPDCLLVEYGSGSSQKVRLLLESLRPAAYLPVDISREHMLQAAARLQAHYPDLEVLAICADYSQPFTIPEVPGHEGARRVGFFPGSSIGNFDRHEAVRFLRQVAGELRSGDGFLVGVDLKKAPAILEAAYDDEAGVTAAFNRNLLARINRELGGTFNLDAFAHEARYNADLGRVEMHLRSLVDQIVTVGDARYRFAAGESIHTENSYKYDIAEFQQMTRDAGFEPLHVWTDAQQWFSVHYVRRN